ncbi:23S rRNA pseudouridine2604 synthase [Paracidovorax anthurii]|uniref:Dual-specificity RNA pseudouridine synthase RluF n=2 Tax=Paracidovorax anthurii TaxID=78229 RepID=A0A328YET7_9BURK|nr:23S rRNA pseudouridine2604 synthase [Paracidovorax anthurii]
MSDPSPRSRLSLPAAGARTSRPARAAAPAAPSPSRAGGERPPGRFTLRTPAPASPVAPEAALPRGQAPAAPRRAPAAAPRPEGVPGTARLNKRMAELGLCSRREADDWIAQGWVRVNGEVAPMGLQVAPTDRIEVDRAAQGQQERQVTILLNKPMGYVSGQAEDGHTPAVALINPRTHWREDPSRQRFSPPQLRGIAPCGRLDIDSVGLLVLTQDGRVARQLIGEDSEVDKEYLVRVHYGDVATDVQAVFPREQLARLCHGLALDGQPLKPAKVDWQNPEQLRFVLTEGKKRQIRRMCELVGLKVVGLKRIRIGRVVLGNLPVGQWRYLGPNEKF